MNTNYYSDEYEMAGPKSWGAGGSQPPPGSPPALPPGPPGYPAAVPLNEAEEMDAAAQLLNVNNDRELEQFLGDLVNTVGGAVSDFASSPLGQQVVGVLKGAAKKALPMVGAAIGGRLGGPEGAQIGSQLAQKAGQVFGLELEGLSPEDQEFEVARRFVRFASETTHHVVRHGWSAWTSARHAARHHAPGLLRPFPGLGRRRPFGFRHPGYRGEQESEGYLGHGHGGHHHGGSSRHGGSQHWSSGGGGSHDDDNDDHDSDDTREWVWSKRQGRWVHVRI